MNFPSDDPLAALLTAAEGARGTPDSLEALLRLMRAEADYLRATDERLATPLDRWVGRLETYFKSLSDMRVSYEMAEQITPWPYGTIKNMVSNKDLTNVGTRSRPELRLGDLILCPRKAPMMHGLTGREQINESIRREQESKQQRKMASSKTTDAVGRARKKFKRAG